MDRIGVVGISWRNGGPEALARFTLPVESRSERLPQLARAIGASELVYLATCNRIEVAFASDGQTPVAAYRSRIFAELAGHAPQAGEAERTLRAWVGEGAAEHIFLVTAGMDSARVGETEISGQVRLAYEQAREFGLLGPRLDRVFEAALKVAKRVHRMTDVGNGRMSLAEIALDYLRARLRRTPGPVALIGVSPMTIRCARSLASTRTPFVIVNRTLARAEQLAEETGGTARPLEAFRDDPDPVEVLILATASPEPVLQRRDLEQLIARAPSGEAPLLIDLAVPPDVAPEDAEALGMTRVGMREIIAQAESNREKRLLELADAREVVDEALIGLRRRMSERLLSPMIAELRRRHLVGALEEVERFFHKELVGLGESERAVVRRWTEILVTRMAHIPSVGLRALAFEMGPAAVDAFFSGVDENLARELREVAEQAGAMPFIGDEGEE